MNFKNLLSVILVIVLVTISVLAAGCADKVPADGENATPAPTPTATEKPTEEITGTPTAKVTPTATGTPQEFIIRIDSYLLIPVGGKTINVGDTLTFRNFEDSRQQRVLVSEDGLWEEDQYLPYMRTVSYTFNETGTYTFYLKGRESNKWVVTVV